jgi:hypothetical protein
MKEITIITNIAKGLIEILGKPERLDIQSYKRGDLKGYEGYLMYENLTYIIRSNGEIESKAGQ